MLAGICSPTTTTNQIDYYLCCGGATVGNNEGLMQCSCYIDSLPDGSWRDTCSPTGFANSILSAYCQQSNRGSRPQTFSNLNVGACSGYNPSSSGYGVSLTNSNGNLVCA